MGKSDQASRARTESEAADAADAAGASEAVDVADAPGASDTPGDSGDSGGAGASGASDSAGRRLAAARIEWGVSVDEVAGYLNLSAATIEALEADAHDKLPGLTFVKGYLRAYAKLLRLAPDDIIARAGFAPERPKEIPVARVPLQRAGRAPRGVNGERHRRRLARAAVAVIALVVLLCLGWAALQYLPAPGVERALQTLNLGAEGDAAGGGAGDGAGAGDAGAGDGDGGIADSVPIDSAEEEDNALIIEDE